MNIETRAQLNNLRMSPRKVRLVVGLIRGKSVQDALTQLSFSKKHVARPIKKLIESAVANAKHNHAAKEETLVIKTVFVNEGKTLHRWMPRAMGRATPLKKRSSHVTLVLAGEGNDIAIAHDAKAHDKKEADHTEDASANNDEKNA